MVEGVAVPIIGLVGPTGAGKSTVAAMLKGLGCAVLDGDRLAREVVLPGSSVLKELTVNFGEDIVCKGGELDRKLLAQRAFKNEKSRQALNSIMHPAITKLMMTKMTSMKALQEAKAIVIDAAALLDTELAVKCDCIIVVTAAEQLRLQRIRMRDGLTEEQAQIRMQAQQHMEYQPPAGIKFAVIDTTKDEAVLRDAVKKVFDDFRRGVAGGAVDTAFSTAD